MIDTTLAKRIKLLGLDVDGVLTDNDVWIGEFQGQRVEFKRYDIQDGLGIRLIQGAGIPVVWVTGREAPSTILRGQELHVSDVVQVNARAKVPAVEKLLAKYGCRWDEMAFVGDDVADTPVLKKVGLPIAVANARDDVKAACVHVTEARGGHGAVREVIEALLNARGEWQLALDRFFGEPQGQT